MPLSRPYYRISRPFTNGRFTQDKGGESYIRDTRYAPDAVHFIRSYQLIEADLVKLLEYVEPAETNLPAHSHRLYELLLRACTEFEANAKAILFANGYKKGRTLNITDYSKIESACGLSGFSTEIPVWTGNGSVRQPFAAWQTSPAASPKWYASYNHVKHNRSLNFDHASLENVLDAVSAVLIVLFAQFNLAAFNPFRTTPFYSELSSGMLSHPNCFLQIKAPQWGVADSYDFDWAILKTTTNPIASYPF
jgi:hypothetical protein